MEVVAQFAPNLKMKFHLELDVSIFALIIPVSPQNEFQYLCAFVSDQNKTRKSNLGQDSRLKECRRWVVTSGTSLTDWFPF